MTTSPSGKLEQLVAAHRDVYTSLLHLCEDLEPPEWILETGCPGWTVRDVFAHVVGLEAIMAGAPEPQHAPPDELPHVRNDFGRYMEVHVDARREGPVADLLLEAREVFSQRLGQLELIGDLETEVDGPMGTRNPAYRTLPIRVFDLWAHEQDIRRAVGRPGHLEGPAAEITLDRILKGVAGRFGRDGEITGTLELAITGTHERTVRIDLTTGAVDPGSDTAADVRVALPFEDLVARACGRADAPSHEVVLLEGDTDLGRMVLDRMVVTP